MSGISRFESFGEFLNQVKNAELGDPRKPDPRLLQIRSALGASEQVPSDGGWLIPSEFIRPLIERIYLDEVVSRCTEFSLSNRTNALTFPVFDESSRINGSRMGGIAVYWQSEADTLISSRPKFGLGHLKTNRLVGLSFLTREIFEDSNSLEIFCSMALSKELSFRLADAIINGDGMGKPLGIMSSPAMITVPKQNGQAPATVVAQNILDMFARLWPASRRNAVWLLHQDAEQQLIKASLAVGTAGSALPLYVPAADDSVWARILGLPAIVIEQCQALGTPGDVILCDLSRVLLATKEVNTDVSLHIKFLTDEVAFRVVGRFDSAPIDQRPITPFTGTNTVSPFVTLAARA